jgi:hypothetical protein
MQRLLTPVEVAALLGTTPATLANLRCTGRYDLKFCKVGRKVMYAPADVEAYLARRTMDRTR